MATPVVTSLSEIATGYTVFESDQVLTHTQLNSVAEYADDQIRLSRARLSGVGLACGLRPSVSGNTVRVTGGAGVTTDGDLLYLDAQTSYDRFRPYDQSFPAYPPLYQGRDVNAAMHPAWELFPTGTEGSPGRPLSQFAAQTGRQLSQLTAVLLMESYRQDDDLCSGTDCDNLGARAVNTRKLLLVGPEAVAALRENATTPAGAYGGLPDVQADRPVLSATLATADQLAAAYRTACTAIHNRLVDALPRIYTVAGGVLGADVVSEAVAAGWTTRLTTYRNAFATAGSGIQYYYDFLKDVVDTYNEFRERLFSDTTVCTPPLVSFPKHLLLGDLASGGGSAANRTGFYPSPVTSRTAGELEQARFLVRRLEAIITHFQVSTVASLQVRVTPSMAEDRPLDDRAIPFYYAAGGNDPIHQRWSYRLVRRGMEAQTYGYNASSYAPAGSAARNPLAFQIGRNTFFRVEGVIGKPVDTAVDAVEELIRDHNLPFSVRAVLLGSDRTRVKRRRGRVTDLHHLHRVIRKDTDERLKDAEAFSAHYGGQVLAADDDDRLFHEQETEAREQVRASTQSKTAQVATHSTRTRGRLGGTHAQYRINATALQQDFSSVIESAADLSFNAQQVATTGYFTALDNLAAGTQTTWLPWIDEIIDWKEEKEDERLLFSKFAAEHPQLEHFGGVTRGGTLVLVHDSGNTVVAELMLPYTCCEEPVEEEEPELQTERPERPVIRQPPVRTKPTVKWHWEREWTYRQPELERVLEVRTDVEDWIRTESEYLRGQIEWQNEFIQKERLTLTNEVMQSVNESYSSLLANQWNIAAATYAQPAYTAQPGTTQPGTTQPGYTIPGGYTGGYTGGYRQPGYGVTTPAADDPLLNVYIDQARVQESKVTVLQQMVQQTQEEAAKSAVETQLAEAQAELGRTLEATANYLVESGTDVSLGSAGYMAVAEMSRGFSLLEGTTLDNTRNAIDSAVTGKAAPQLEMVVKAAIPRG